MRPFSQALSRTGLIAAQANKKTRLQTRVRASLERKSTPFVATCGRILPSSLIYSSQKRFYASENSEKDDADPENEIDDEDEDDDDVETVDSPQDSASVIEPKTFDPELNSIRLKISADPEFCVQELKTVLEQAPENSDALQLMAAALEHLQRTDEAIVYLEKAVAVSSVEFIRDRRLYCHLAQMQRIGENLDSAIKSVKAGLALAAPNDFWGRGLFFHELGEIESSRGHYEPSIKAYETAIKLFEKVGENTQISITQKSLGIAYMQANKTQQAFDTFLTVITRGTLEDPTIPLMCMCDLALRTKFNFHAARTWLNLASEIRQGQSNDIHFLLGYINSIIGDWEQALKHLLPRKDIYLELIRTAAPGDMHPQLRAADFARSFAWCLIRAGDIDGAAEIVREAEKVVDHDSDYHLMKARLAIAQGKDDEATQILENSLAETHQWDVSAKLITHLVYTGKYEKAIERLRIDQADPEIIKSVEDAFPEALVQQHADFRKRPLSTGCKIIREIRVQHYNSLFLDALIALMDGELAAAKEFLSQAQKLAPQKADMLQGHFEKMQSLLSQ